MSDTEHEQQPDATEAEEATDSDGEATEDDETGQEEEEQAETTQGFAAPPGLTEKEAERVYKAIDRAQKGYAEKIPALFGELGLEVFGCPLCADNIVGFVSPEQAGRFEDHVVREVMRFLGQAYEVEYEQDPNHRVCGTCSGLGKVRSGSRVPGRETLACSACNGHGYVPPPGAATNGPAHVTEAGLADFAPEVAPSFQERDPWGEARLLPDGRENPNYGKQPQYKILVEPWGITAGLEATAELEGAPS